MSRTDKIEVQWASSSNATTYEIWRSTSSDLKTAVRLGSITGTLWDDTTPQAGLTYYYWVRAGNSLGLGSFSASVSGVRKP